MKNMKLPEELQGEIREFMMSTYSNLDHQKELNEFYSIISPSLKDQVVNFILTDAITKNETFKGNKELIDYLVNDVTT